MTHATQVVSPTLHLAWSHPHPPLLDSLREGLPPLHATSAGGTIGYALGHMVNGHLPGGEQTEYLCAVIALPGALCAVQPRLLPGTAPVLDKLARRWQARPRLARYLQYSFGFDQCAALRKGRFVTLHLCHFTLTLQFAGPGAPDLRIYMKPSPSLKEAKRRVVELQALFIRLSSPGAPLAGTRIDLPDAEALLALR